MLRILGKPNHWVPLRQVCFKRNVHQRQKDDIDRLAQQWEEPPTLYTQLDVTCLFEERKDAVSSRQFVEIDSSIIN